MKGLVEWVGAATLITPGLFPGASGHALQQGLVGSGLAGGGTALESTKTVKQFADRPEPSPTTTTGGGGGRPEHRTLFSSDSNDVANSDDALDANGSVSANNVDMNEEVDLVDVGGGGAGGGVIQEECCLICAVCGYFSRLPLPPLQAKYM